MAQTDPGSEQQLRDNYARMPDGELQAIASDARDLTSEAQALIAEEISRRKLPAQEVVDTGSDDLEYQPWVTIANFSRVNDALLAKACLESAGITARVADEFVLGFYISSIPFGGARVLVKPEDDAAAREFLEQPILENFEIPGMGTYEQPRCPRCSSLDVAFRESMPGAEAVFPFPAKYRAWRCGNCSAEWEEDSEHPAGSDDFTSA
jgi:Putative prokaryotic signal transducing protein